MAYLKPQVPFIGNENRLGTPVYPSLPPQLAFTQGNIWHVKPYSGSDVNNSGKNPGSAFKTLANALSHAVASQNDIVLFYGEGNASALCTDYQSNLLDWNKDMVHLIGINSGVSESPRNRITMASTYNAATDVFKMSANGCFISGVQIWNGLAGSTLPTGAMTVTGRLNKFKNCHIVGFGHTNQDKNGAYSINIKGGIQNEFEDCVIGSYTVPTGAAATNSEILYTAATASGHGNIFKRCRIEKNADNSTNSIFLIIPTLAIGGGGIEIFEDCQFINSGTGLTNAFTLSTTAGGIVVLGEKSKITGAAHTIASATSSILYGPQATGYSVATAALEQALGG